MLIHHSGQLMPGQRRKNPSEGDSSTSEFGAKLRLSIDDHLRRSGVTMVDFAKGLPISREGLYKAFKSSVNIGPDVLKELVDQIDIGENERFEVLFAWITERAEGAQAVAHGKPEDIKKWLPRGMMRAFRDIERSYAKEDRDSRHIREILVKAVFYHRDDSPSSSQS